MDFAWICYGLGVNLHSFAMELLWMCTDLCGFAMIVYGSAMHCVTLITSEGVLIYIYIYINRCVAIWKSFVCIRIGFVWFVVACN